MDDELEEIKKKQLQDMLKEQQRISEPTVMELDASNFDEFLSSNEMVLVDFWAQWCGPCKSMHPIYEKVAAREHQVKFSRVNVDKAQSIAQKYQVQSIPTFIMFKQGLEINRMTGAVGEAGLNLIIAKYTSKDSGRR